MFKVIKITLVTAIIAITFLAVGMLVSSFNAAPSVEYGQVSIETDTEASLVVIKLELDLLWEAASTYDTSRFHEVYVNDPSVPLNKKQEATNREYNTNAKGLLDSKTAMIKRAQKGYENIKKIDEKAKAEGRKPTAADYKEYLDKGEPIGPYANTAPRPKEPPPFKLLNAKIENNRLILEVHANFYDTKYIMVKTKEGMRIAGIETIKSYV
jgi:hypothetical protein